VLDLREVSDLDSLDGRTIELDGGVGRIEVILPDDIAADITADVDGPGNIRLFGQEHGGIDINRSTSVGVGRPFITIDAQLGVGQIEVDGDGDVRCLLPVPWVLAGLAGLLAIGISGSRRWTTRQVGWVGADQDDEKTEEIR
jgi:hypothetical protein